MLNDASIPVNHVLQVWYSSTWSKGTFSSFKRSVWALELPAQKPGIHQLVDFWKSAAAPDLTNCRREWLRYFVNDARKWDACTIASLVRQLDRLAACRYFLTGDVCDEREESADQLEVGSLTMWALPLGSLPLRNADSIFATMSLEDYLPVPEQADSIIQLFVNDISKKLNSIRQLLLEGRLEIEIWQDELTSDSCQLLSRISALSPAGISWSNLLDYTDFASFHAVAARCSAPDSFTTHYAYSMEWVKDVYGITLADWCRGRQALRASLLVELETGKALPAFARKTQLSTLALPGFGCPSRMWMYVTAMHLHKSWAARFVSKGSTTAQNVTLHSLGMCLPFMMHRRFPTNLFLQWSYSRESPEEYGESKPAKISQAMQCYDAIFGEVVVHVLETTPRP